MKKRLLITSIVMMLVVALALSTATYAWFTSNTSVKANSVTLTAATMDADALMISKTSNNDGLSDVVSLAALTGALYPATPNAANTLTAASPVFGNLEVQGDGTALVKSLPANTSSYYTDTVYVYNKGSQAVTVDGTTISIAYGLDAAAAEAAASVRIALLEQVGTSTANGSASATLASATLVGIYEIDQITAVLDTEDEDNDEDTTETIGYTATTKLSNAADTYGYTGAGDAKSKNNITFTGTGFHAINPALSGNYICNGYTVVMWLEGWDAQCTNAVSSGAFNVGLEFKKAPAQQGD